MSNVPPPPLRNSNSGYPHSNGFPSQQTPKPPVTLPPAPGRTNINLQQNGPMFEENPKNYGRMFAWIGGGLAAVIIVAGSLFFGNQIINNLPGNNNANGGNPAPVATDKAGEPIQNAQIYGLDNTKLGARERITYDSNARSLGWVRTDPTNIGEYTRNDGSKCYFSFISTVTPDADSVAQTGNDRADTDDLLLKFVNGAGFPSTSADIAANGKSNFLATNLGPALEFRQVPIAGEAAYGIVGGRVMNSPGYAFLSAIICPTQAETESKWADLTKATVFSIE